MTPTHLTKESITAIYHQPLLDLIYQAATVHRSHHNHREIQINHLISIKTGGCPEDCAYCPQAARFNTEVKVHRLISVKEVVEAAAGARQSGATRICMGAAWREIRDNRDFDRVIEMVTAVKETGMEVCCTLGMLSFEQALRLKQAGLYAYNHNLDTSEENYNNIIGTRTYRDRLNTLDNVRKAGITVCCGGIIGMGESVGDRIGLLYTLSNLEPQPQSVPINALVAVKGTPLEKQKKVTVWDMARMIATARIIMPAAMIRLSAGRMGMSMDGQALCFMAGANSIFAGDKLLTTPNPSLEDDKEMLEILGLKPIKSIAHES